MSTFQSHLVPGPEDVNGAKGVSTSEEEVSSSDLQDTTPLDPNNDVLFFPVHGIDTATFENDFPLSPRNGTYLYQNNQSQVHGKKISINGKEIALFCYKSSFYALDEKCPHLGGPLHLGDIEDLCSPYSREEAPYVVCPWHKWSFKLSSGKQVWPPGQQGCVNVYPVRTTQSGQIQIGFSKIDPAYFSPDCEF